MRRHTSHATALIFALHAFAMPIFADSPSPTPPTPATAPTLPNDLTKPISSITPDSLMAIVSALPAQRNGWGSVEGRKGLDAARKLLLDKVKALGFSPRLEPVKWSRRQAPAPSPPNRDNRTDPADTPDHTFDPYANIIFEIPGTTKPLEVILLAAHFDAYPEAPGADDNASGVAGLIEIARALKDAKPHRTIRFALFDLEEAGLVGAQQHAQRWREAQDDIDDKAKRERIVLMLSLEMLGYYDPSPTAQKNPFNGIPGLPKGDQIPGDFIALATVARHSFITRALDAAMRQSEPELKTVVVDQFPVAPPDLLRSDHVPFLMMGIPSIMVTDTANFRNPNYHKPTDTPDTLNPPLFARTVRALANATATLASAPSLKPDPKPEAKPPAKPDTKPQPAPAQPTQPTPPTPK
jgi:hypothetical protein